LAIGIPFNSLVLEIIYSDGRWSAFTTSKPFRLQNGLAGDLRQWRNALSGWNSDLFQWRNALSGWITPSQRQRKSLQIEISAKATPTGFQRQRRSLIKPKVAEERGYLGTIETDVQPQRWLHHACLRGDETRVGVSDFWGGAPQGKPPAAANHWAIRSNRVAVGERQREKAG